MNKIVILIIRNYYYATKMVIAKKYNVKLWGKNEIREDQNKIADGLICYFV